MIAARSLVDVHAHLAVLGRTPREGYVSPHMLRGAAAWFIQRRLGVAVSEPERLNRVYVSRLLAEIAGSRFVGAAVVLALDGVYDASGELDLARTHFYVPNDAVLALAREHPSLLAGASVNPRRRDALDELERVAAGGARLVKWLPNSQLFDPADEANVPFFRALARLRLPLLIHSGVEFTVTAGSQGGGDPARWRLALDQGATVIAAHAGSSGLVLWERYIETLCALMARYPNLIADSSALAMPNRSGMLLRLRRRPAALARLTFATDYPLPPVPAVLLACLAPRAWLRARAERNYFDRQVRVLEGLGWEPTSEPFLRLPAPDRGAKTAAAGSPGA